MTFKDILDRFAAAACAGDGTALAALFTEDGVYHDGFYGAFAGRAAIRDMLEGYFHRDARDFKWEMFDAVREDEIGYARYRFSFTSRLANADGRRVLFEGIARFRFRGELIADYDEVFDSGLAMAQLGFPAERIARSLAKRAEALRAAPESRPHLAA